AESLAGKRLGLHEHLTAYESQPAATHESVPAGAHARSHLAKATMRTSVPVEGTGAFGDAVGADYAASAGPSKWMGKSGVPWGNRGERRSPPRYELVDFVRPAAGPRRD